MKSIPFLGAAILVIASASACHSNKEDASSTDSGSTSTTKTIVKTRIIPGKYTSLETGQPIYIVVDTVTGYAIDSLTKVPVAFYINTEGDTLTTTGDIAHELIKADDGTWKLSDDAKIKVDGDKIKIKDGDRKIKIDGDESKVKDGDYKKKTDGDKSKEKDGDSKVKQEDGEVKVKN